MKAPHVLVITHSPSPYQVELFDAIAAIGEIELTVLYVYASDPARSWAKRRALHSHYLLARPSEQGGSDGWNARIKRRLFDDADLLVINWYAGRQVRQLYSEWLRSGKPSTFWGERPGFRHPRLGRWVRRWYLRHLHRSNAPVWGVGEFAVRPYRAEFGEQRDYVNLPYFSDLERFSACTSKARSYSADRVVLFSGSLIERKGVDLLAQAFRAVAPSYPGLQLHLLGNGPLESRLRQELEPVQRQVRFLGFRDWDELPEAYSGGHVLCVPSRYDGWGLVVPEGLAAGLPVIATKRMGAAIDLVTDQHNGWLVKAGDPHALAAVLRDVASMDDEALRAMSDAAARSVAAHGLEHGARRFGAAALQALGRVQ